MSKTPTPTKREAASVGAILWIRSMDDTTAPVALGGQTAAEQARIVRGHVERDGLVLDRILYGVGPDAGDADSRLQLMLQMLEQSPIERVYISGAVYAGDSDDERMKHHLMLFMRGVQLTICEGE